MSLVMDKARSQVTCGSCSLRVYHCERSPEIDDKACGEYIPPHYEHMIIDSEGDQCAVIVFEKWNYQLAYMVLIENEVKFQSYVKGSFDSHFISDELSKALADLCGTSEAEMFLQALEAVDELQKQEWYR